MKFCVYTHIRKDLKTPFYVGKGVKDRPFEKYNRSSWWKNIVAKHGYEVKIIKWFDDDKDALKFERELQLQYLAIGHDLCNISECGGKGSKGVKHSHEAKKIISDRSRRMWSENLEYVNRMRESSRGLNNAFSDKKRYTFFHKNHGYVTCTQYELRSMHGLDSSKVSSLVHGYRFKSKGWSLAEHRNFVKGDNRICVFKHVNGDVIVGKKMYFLEHHPDIKPSSLTRAINDEYKQTKGWSVEIINHAEEYSKNKLKYGI